MKKLYLVRHGQTLFNLRKKTQGWCDSPLTPLGIQQAKATSEYLKEKGIHFDAVYSSTSERCCDTTELLTDQPYKRLKGLKEWNFGILEGEPEDLQRSRDPWSGTIANTHGDFFVRFGGESEVEVQERMNKTLKEIMDQEGHNSVLAVSHAGASWMFYLTRNTAAEVPGLEFGNCCVLEYEYDGQDFKFISITNPARDLK